MKLVILILLIILSCSCSNYKSKLLNVDNLSVTYENNHKIILHKMDTLYKKRRASSSKKEKELLQILKTFERDSTIKAPSLSHIGMECKFQLWWNTNSLRQNSFGLKTFQQTDDLELILKKYNVNLKNRKLITQIIKKIDVDDGILINKADTAWQTIIRKYRRELDDNYMFFHPEDELTEICFRIKNAHILLDLDKFDQENKYIFCMYLHEDASKSELTNKLISNELFIEYHIKESKGIIVVEKKILNPAYLITHYWY